MRSTRRQRSSSRPPAEPEPDEGVGVGLEEEELELPDGAEIALQFFLAGLEPPPRLSVAEWADRHRVLPEDAPIPGRWRTDRAPYLRAIMDALSAHSPVSHVVLKKGTQIGATEIGNNWLGYLIHHAPQTLLYVEPTDGLAKRVSKQRIEPMIRSSDALRGLVEGDEAPGSRKARRETILEKYWPGGRLTLASAKSSAALRNLSSQNLFADELDEWDRDVGKQGDPLALALKRLDAFDGRSKVFLTSTPTNAGSSRICDFYDQTDQQVLEVPCPHCNHYQQITWNHIRWPKDPERPEEAYMLCEACGACIAEDAKLEMLSRGRWIATATGKPGWVGFFLPALYSPWFRWSSCANQFLEAKGDPLKMKAFSNTVLGEAFHDRITAVDETSLALRVEDYKAEVPPGVLCITAGFDTQDDRLEGEVVGWGLGFESWGLGYYRIYGQPDGPTLWTELMDRLNHTYRHLAGFGIPIAATCIDSRGHYTNDVYRFCAGKEARRIFAIAGVADNGQRPLVGAPIKKRTGQGERHCVLYDVCTGVARGHVYGRFSVDAPGPGYCHWPADGRGYDEEYFRQIASMEFSDRPHMGRLVREWTLKRGRRKEALDARCYALAALYLLNPEWTELQKRRLRQASGGSAGQSTPDRSRLEAPPPAGRRDTGRRPGRSNWVTGW